MKPVSEWMTFYTGYDPVRRNEVAAQFQQVEGSAPVPSEAKDLTILVHGFNVTAAEGSQEAETLFKRLYWVGHPVVRSQGGAHTIGILWPGWIAPKYIPVRGERPAIPDTPAAQFGTSEYHAYQAGVPLARLFDRLHTAGRTLNVLAHSLGNMAVNSAIREGSANTLRSYTMAEAAVPIEAFLADFSPGASPLLDTARSCGSPTDQLWVDRWRDMEAGLPLTPEGHPDRSDLARWNDAVLARNSLLPAPNYVRRWLERPSPQAAWAGVFSNTKGARVLNTYNRADNVVGVVWPLHQRLEKCSTFGRASVQWALPIDRGLASMPRRDSPLSEREAENQRALWQPGNPDWPRVEEWARLAYWYVPVSRAAGVAPIQGGPSILDLDMTSLAVAAGPRESHSYFLVRPYHEVWRFYEQCSSFMRMQ